MKKPEAPPEYKRPEVIFHSTPITDRSDAFNERINLFLYGGVNHTDELKSKIKEIDKDYPYWDEFKYKVKGINEDPKKLWIYLKKIIREDGTYLKLIDNLLFTFRFNVRAKTQQLLHEFDLNLGGSLTGSDGILEEDKNKYLISSIMEEAIASSQIEGAVTTREVAKEMLRKERKPRNTSEQMILNNYITIKRIIELKKEPLTKQMLLEIHAMMTKGTLDDVTNEGQFRINNNVNVVDPITGEIFYSPPDYKYFDEVITALCNFASAKNDEEFIHPIVRASILHFLIGYIHPFVDGNGRTARAIFYWYLLSQGYWLVEYMSISRIIIKSPSQYAMAYLHSELDENDVTYFINYQIRALDLAYEELRQYIDRKIREKKELFILVKVDGVNNRQLEIIRHFMNENKTMTIHEAKTMFNVTNQTANTDMNGLVEKGFLITKKIGKTFHFFKSDGFDKKVKAAK